MDVAINLGFTHLQYSHSNLKIKSIPLPLCFICVFVCVYCKFMYIQCISKCILCVCVWYIAVYLVHVWVYACMYSYVWINSHLCVCVNIRMQVFVTMYKHALRGQHLVLFWWLSTLYFKTGSLTEPKAHQLARLTKQWALGICLPSSHTTAPSLLVVGIHISTTISGFCMSTNWEAKLKSSCLYDRHITDWAIFMWPQNKTIFFIFFVPDSSKEKTVCSQGRWKGAHPEWASPCKQGANPCKVLRCFRSITSSSKFTYFGTLGGECHIIPFMFRQALSLIQSSSCFLNLEEELLSVSTHRCISKSFAIIPG